MNGDRDSEIAHVIEDMQYEDGMMNEKLYRRGITASKLRLQLFREHLGLSDDDTSIADPTSDHTWHSIKSTASNNTKIFEAVFDCAPSNRMRAFVNFQSIEVTKILFENKRMNVLKVPGRSHLWDENNLKEWDYAPWNDTNGKPIATDRIDRRDFEVDNYRDRKKKLFSMDHDGWCYARNFSVFQQVRTMKTNYKKYEKLQHLVADRLTLNMTSINFSQLDSGGTGAPRGRRLTNSTSILSNIVGERRTPVLSDTVLFSNSPHFHQTPHSLFVIVAVGGPRKARSASYVGALDRSIQMMNRLKKKSDYGGGNGILNAEYFDTDDDRLDEDDSQMDDGRGSYHAATREGHLTEKHGAEEGNGQGKTRQRGRELPVDKTHECHAGEKGSNAYGHDARDHFGLYGHILVVRIVERRTNGGGHGTEKKERKRGALVRRHVELDS
ncbi:hypothetical protein PsorP6_006229 [Peronosclerospora sorghi]|uniref:Uncharacterized protein n=1 Tax=Peronosclerospora sorghi TaxID=230839 RepID=A0ACC0W8H2_9STRA|nr:hypothetical protein PsorP6_006229 [Peronosclerospora sorghi]